MKDDELLDKALAQYSNVEPLAGLEQRLLQRVRAEGSPRRAAYGRWASGLAVAALLLATAIWWGRPPVLSVELLQSQLRARVAPAPPIALAASAPRERVRSVPHRRPMPDVFPTPARATPEERALLALATTAPDQALEALLDLQRRSAEPIHIEEIKIEPLRSPDANDDAK